MAADAEPLAADVVVVGSGAGGAPVAAVLAESGRRVVLLEAGPRLEAGDFTGDEGEMTARLCRNWHLFSSRTSVAGRPGQPTGPDVRLLAIHC